MDGTQGTDFFWLSERAKAERLAWDRMTTPPGCIMPGSMACVDALRLTHPYDGGLAYSGQYRRNQTEKQAEQKNTKL